MEVILKEDVTTLGHAGDVVKVADGYGRNYLLPRRLAIEATAQNRAVIEQMKQAAVRRSANEKAKAEQLLSQLENVELEFTRKADVYAYEHRKQKKRDFRSLWITRLSAALRQRGINYNRFIPALVAAGIDLNRKMLSELAIGDPATFDAIVEQARPHLADPAAGQKKAKAA